ncbi:MAG TPA: F0F1 ATP synthase subunit epsilon [Candidatus Binataceae bacterium]|nr:F0F1 ATP synthase subunit epsilon [Candidatus Binataceae bacterium]
MKLVVTTPTEIAVDEDSVGYVRAEDSSGAFGIEPRHADLLTTLAICVVRWRTRRNTERYVAVRGGVLRVRGGKAVEIATREAVVGDDLARLRGEVLAAMTQDVVAEQAARAGTLRLEHAAIRQIQRYLRPADRPIKTKPQE